MQSRFTVLVRKYGAQTKAKMPDYDFKPKPYKGPCYETIVEIRRNKLLNTSTTYKKPLLINQASMQWLYDHTGKRYLDLFAGYCTVNVGHCHPMMMETVKNELPMLVHCSNHYLQKNLHVYAEKLLAKFPVNSDLKKIYITNTGTEANELALLLARLHTKHRDVLSLRSGFHGMSPATRSLTSNVGYTYSEPERRGMIHVMNPDPYHGLWGGSNCRDSISQVKGRKCKCKDKNDCAATKKYINQLQEAIRYCVPKKGVAAMFMEIIQGVAGGVCLTRGYVKKAAEIVRANGGLLVLDEVQTAFGRTGTSFFGFEDVGVAPDIIILGKGICSGFPMSAVVTTPKIAECFKQAEYLSTHAGNPFVTALAATNLDIIEKDCLMKNAHVVGQHCLKKMMGIRDKFPDCVGDVRGKGFTMGMEMVDTVKDRDGKTQKVPMSQKHMEDIHEDLKDAGVIVAVGGLYHNVFRFQPPMCVDKQDIDFGMDVVCEVLTKHKQRLEGRGETKQARKCKN